MTIRLPLTRLLACILFVLGSLPAFAVTRVVTITAPTETKPGSELKVAVAASTDATDGERIGFLHSEYSLDGGKTWTSVTYEQKLGRTATRILTLTAGAEGTKVIVRARAAFRDGKAGDVDFKGGAIDWGNSWEKWLTPPARNHIIYIR
jgi:hypothetical protein